LRYDRFVRFRFLALAAAMAALGGAVGTMAQRRDAFSASREHRAIAYAADEGENVVRRLGAAIDAGTRRLTFEPEHGRGYLRSVLEALGVPIESQMLVFSETSKQAKHISPSHPRAIYFNDAVAVAWVPGTDLLELAAHDPRQGVVFYTLEQRAVAKPLLKRDVSCLLCHLTWDTLAVPGLTTLSTFPMSDDPNAYADGVVVDARTPIAERWGGWYVTGRLVPQRHMGNAPVIRPAADLAKPFAPPPKLDTIAHVVAEPADYLSPYSDVAALMVFNHQTHATNLLTWVGWETRVAIADRTSLDRVDDAVAALVDDFLFADEAQLPGTIEGGSGFVQKFAAAGPRDASGRSLRQLDLSSRLMRYPLSYMIDSGAFDALPEMARQRIYARLWRVLSGEDPDRRYARLTTADRRAIIEILRATKKDLPAVFR
jgi:hypothetical protein